MRKRPPQAGGKARLDVLLCDRGMVESREKAKALILAGRVTVGGARADKAGMVVSADAELTLAEGLPYVSRGGFKLAGALDAFSLDPRGLRILDGGISTGGFTDCLLQRGAAEVAGVDVGYGQVDWRLRSDPRVHLFERTNLRHLTAGAVGGSVDAAVVDVSFISLRLVLPAVAGVVRPGGWIVVLVKPQFEVGRDEVGKGGIVRDEGKRLRVLEDLTRFAEDMGLGVIGRIESPIAGAKGNREFLVGLRTPPEAPNGAQEH